MAEVKCSWLLVVVTGLLIVMCQSARMDQQHSSGDLALKQNEDPKSASAFKWVQFGVSLAFNRVNQRVISTKNKWELWNEVFDLNGQSTGIILGQLPATNWKTPDETNRAWFWGRTWHHISWEDFLDEQNIRGDLAVVEDFEMEYTGLKESMENRTGNKSVRVLQLPQADMGGMDPDKIKSGVDFLHDVLTQHPGSKVYVHCKAGRGRSAAVVMAYLATHHGMDLALAHLVVRASRTHINVDAHKIPDLHSYMVKYTMGHDENFEPVFFNIDGKTIVDLHKSARECLWEAISEGNSQNQCSDELQVYDAELGKAVDATDACDQRGAKLDQGISSKSYYQGNRKLDYVCRCTWREGRRMSCKEEGKDCPKSKTGMSALSLSADAWKESAFRLLKCDKCKCE